MNVINPIGFTSAPDSLPRPSDRRVWELDGIRGWAAFSVLLDHVFWEVFGHVVPSFRNPLTAGFFNGGIDVAVFFMLSGEALSASFLANGKIATVTKMLAKRYLRLTIPIFFSCLISFLLMKMGLIFNHEAGIIVGSPEWLGRFLSFDADIRGFLYYSIFGVYDYEHPERSYNEFLWTMRPEFLGSMMIFLILFAKSSTKYFVHMLVLLAGVFLLMNSLLACFPIGVLFAWMRINGIFTKLGNYRNMHVISAFALIFIFGEIGFMQVHSHVGAQPCTVLGGGFLFFAFCNKKVCRFFGDSFISRELGRISFPLYLVHWGVLLSFTSWAIIKLNAAGHLNQVTGLEIAMASVFFSVAAAYAFLPVEWLTQTVNNRWASFILKG